MSSNWEAPDLTALLQLLAGAVDPAQQPGCIPGALGSGSTPWGSHCPAKGCKNAAFWHFDGVFPCSRAPALCLNLASSAATGEQSFAQTACPKPPVLGTLLLGKGASEFGHMGTMGSQQSTTSSAPPAEHCLPCPASTRSVMTSC